MLGTKSAMLITALLSICCFYYWLPAVQGTPARLQQQRNGLNLFQRGALVPPSWKPLFVGNQPMQTKNVLNAIPMLCQLGQRLDADGRCYDVLDL